MGSPGLVVWRLIPFAIVWTIWKVRNELKFEGIQPNWECVSDHVIARIALWATSSPKLQVYSTNDLILNIQSIIG